MSDNAVPDTQAVQSQDQASPVIQDQATPTQEQSEQPTQDSPSPEEELIEINGQKLSKKEIAEGIMRQEDYTRKTQELAEKQRQLVRSPIGDQKKSEDLPPEAQKFFEDLKVKGGFMTKEEYQQMIALDQDRKELDRIVEENPHLKPVKESIYAVGAKDSRAWHDIIKDPQWGFNNLKPKDKPVREVGGKAPSMQQEGAKSIKDMTPEEFEVWEKKNISKTKFVRK